MGLIVTTTATGEPHGLVDIRTNSVEFDDFKHMDEKTKAEVKARKLEDDKIVNVRYINKRSPGERLDKAYCKYAGDPIRMYHLVPNHTYDLPMGFVNEVNGIKIPRRSGLQSLDGQDLIKGGAPLEKDRFEEGEHLLVSTKF